MDERRRQNLTAAGAALLLLGALILLAENAAGFAAVLRSRMLLCMQTLVPSLYGSTAAALLLRESGAGEWLGGKCRRTARLFGMRPACFSVFVISQLAGYPAGAVLLSRMQKTGILTTAESTRLCGLCFGCGPAFAVGLAGSQLLGSAAAGWMLFGAGIAANAVLALLTRPRGMLLSEPVPSPRVYLDASMLTGAVSGTMRSLVQICGMVMLSGLAAEICRVLRLTALPDALSARMHLPPQMLRAICAAAADITQLEPVCGCGLPFRLLLALTGGLLSFGGLCVHLQCRALGGICPMRKLLLQRFFAGILAAFLLYAAAPLLPVPEASAVFAPRTAVSAQHSVLPALLIFCTGFPFLIKKD